MLHARACVTGTENDPELVHNNGNVKPHRGFGHVAMMVDDVYVRALVLTG
jgi:hypothetical protein